MLLFIPQIILSSALVILIAGNLFQRNFRSSWLLTMSSAGLALASLVFLRFRLPLSLSFSAWWAGEGLVSTINFLLDGVSWQIAFVLSGLVLSFFLMEVPRAMSAPWLNWATYLALAIASLFAAVAGDILTLAFFWILVDALTGLAIFRLFAKAEERRAALSFMPANITASFLLLASWILTDSTSQIANLLVLSSAALRLGIFAPVRESSVNGDQFAILRWLPAASVLVLLARPVSLGGISLIIVLVLLMLPAIFFAFKSMQPESGAEALIERGFATLAIAAAAVGQPGAALGFGLAVLAAWGLLSLAQTSGRLRWPVIVASVVLLSGLIFSPLISANQIYASLIAFAYLPVHAALIAGWSRQALTQSKEQPAGEPWMRVTRTIGSLLVPLMFLFLGLGLAPTPSIPVELIGWPAVFVIALAAIFFLASERLKKRFLLPPSLANLLQVSFSMSWLQTPFNWMLSALGWVLHMTSRVLEGQAGVLWAMLLIALLLSLALQFALGS